MKFRFIAVALTISVACASAYAQLDGRAHNLTLPTASPGASVTQEIGLSTVTIEWHRPGVKDREIWGTSLAPYGGDPTLWRAGANENTTITVSHDCTINGNALPAGTYGFHTIPTEGDWTLVFSTNSTSWGSYFYNPEEDALRVTVTPEEAPHEEWLRYGFEDLSEDSATAYLVWETKKVPFEIAFDTHEIVLESIRNQLRNVPAFTWQGWWQAAKYCFDQGINDEEAMAWLDQSIARGEHYLNLSLKAQYLVKQGKNDEAKPLLERAIELAPENRQAKLRDLLESL